MNRRSSRMERILLLEKLVLILSIVLLMGVKKKTLFKIHVDCTS